MLLVEHPPPSLTSTLSSIHPPVFVGVPHLLSASAPGPPATSAPRGHAASRVAPLVVVAPAWPAFASLPDTPAVTISLSYHHTDHFSLQRNYVCFLHHFSLS